MNVTNQRGLRAVHRKDRRLLLAQLPPAHSPRLRRRAAYSLLLQPTSWWYMSPPPPNNNSSCVKEPGVLNTSRTLRGRYRQVLTVG